MGHRFDPQRLPALVSERRRQAIRPRELLQRLGLGPGAVVWDLGCGAGFFTLPAAEVVGPTGQVIATDVQPEMVQATREAAAAGNFSNIRVYLTGDYEAPPALPPVDWVLLAYVLHEVAEPRRLLALAAANLKPQGRLVILEWPKEDGPHGPPVAERLSPEEVRSFYEPLQLRPLLYLERKPEYYVLVLAHS